MVEFPDNRSIRTTVKFLRIIYLLKYTAITIYTTINAMSSNKLTPYLCFFWVGYQFRFHFDQGFEVVRTACQTDLPPLIGQVFKLVFPGIGC
jgi:hypothetical protein